MTRSTHSFAFVLGLILSGCSEMPDLPGFLGPADKDDAADVTRQSSFEQPLDAPQSKVIAALLARDAIFAAGSPYDTVASAALSASARVSEAELTSARLRAEAKSKNWLPTLGPSVTLTSLGDVVAQILIEQVLFDNGRRKAERAFAAADVEVAAVNLAIDMNTRVETAVALYLAALRADEKAALNRRALERMAEFERIVTGRVQGGVSDRSDLRVVQAKINDIRSALKAAEEAGASSRAELKAMTGQRFDGMPARLDLADIPSGQRHLTVLLAEAQATRSVAEAKVERAGLLPGLTASAGVGSAGTSGQLKLDTDAALGFGTPALMKAIKAAEETAGRQVDEAVEDARRSISRQMQRLSSYRRQEAEAAELAQSSRVTFNLFQGQARAGQRTVPEVVSVYEQLVEREQAHVDAKYEVVLIQLEIARDLGLLADGDRI